MSVFGTINNTSEVKETVTANPTPGSTINLTVTPGKNTVCIWTAGEDETVNISSGVPSVGDELTLIILNDATLGRTITPGTLLTSSGAIVGVISLVSIIKFIGNGIKFIEVSRTVGI